MRDNGAMVSFVRLASNSSLLSQRDLGGISFERECTPLLYEGALIVLQVSQLHSKRLARSYQSIKLANRHLKTSSTTT